MLYKTESLSVLKLKFYNIPHETGARNKWKFSFTTYDRFRCTLFFTKKVVQFIFTFSIVRFVQFAFCTRIVIVAY